MEMKLPGVLTDQFDEYGGVFHGRRAIREKKEVGLRVRRSGDDFGLLQELDGYDWALVLGEGNRHRMVSTEGKYLTAAFQTPHVRATFSRETGDLAIVTLSGLDLVYLAGLKMPLATGDGVELGVQKNKGTDVVVCLSFTDGPRVSTLVLADGVYRPIETVGSGELMSKYGQLPDQPCCIWNGDLGFLRGKLGFVVYVDSVVFFYEHNGTRLNIVEFPRRVPDVIRFDGIASEDLPTEEQVEEFLEKVYVPLI